MMMEEGSNAFEWKVDDFGIDVTAAAAAADDDDMSMDIESLMSILEESQPDNSVQNGLVDPLESIAPRSDTSSCVGVNEHIGAHNGDFVDSFRFSPSDQSGASTSGTICSVGSSESERQMVNPGFTKLEFQPDVSSMNYSSTSLGDWAMPAMRNDNPIVGFSEQDGNRQPMDAYGMTDGIYDSVADSYRTSEAPDNVESLFLDFCKCSDIVYDPHDEILFPFFMTENSRPDTQFTDQSFLQSDASIKKQLKYTKEIEFPRRTNMGLSPQKIQQQVVLSTTYYNDNDPDICILEDMSEPAAKIQTYLNGKPIVTAHRSSISIPSTQMGFNNTRLKANDERFIYQAALQDLSQPNSEATPPDGALAVPLLRHQMKYVAANCFVMDGTKRDKKICIALEEFSLMIRQGLGKTISTIALILKERSPSSNIGTIKAKAEMTETLNLDDDEAVTKFNKCEQNMKTDGSMIELKVTPVQTTSRPSAGTLVVCPTSVLRQWNDELRNKVSSESNLSVLVYHGGNRTKDPFELAKYDVVLTTYAIVSMEVPKQPLVDEDDDETKKRNDFHPMGLSSTKKRKYPPTSGKSSKKDKKEIDNELFESLARPLAKVRWFRVVLDEAQSIKNHRTQVARACWGLRAKRRWCLSGTPIQNAIDDLYSYFRFLRYDPYAVYKSFCSTIKVPIQRNPVNGYKKLQAVLKTIMLRRTKCTLLDGEPIISLPPKTVNMKKVDFTAEEREFYCRLEAESRAQFEEYAAAGTVKQNYVNILLMLLRLRQACDHPLLVRGCSSNSEWRSSIEKAKKLTPEKRNGLRNCLEASLAICSICNDPPEDAVVTTCEHVFCNQCILELLSSDDCQCPSSKCKSLLGKSSVFSRSTLRLSIGDQPQPRIGNDLDCSGSVKPEDIELCSSNGLVNSSKIDAAEALESSKIKAAIDILQSIAKPQAQEIKMNDGSKDVLDTIIVREKAIIFSQWTRMLDLLEACLKDSSISYRRLDGTMSVVARDKAVKDFNSLPEVTVMIMSLKAASLGLNMVAACHVVLLDLWWNPTTEDQAIDRAHRIGQTRPVTVLRLTVKNTVEDRILALQQKKREMASSVFGEDETGSHQTRLTVDDLKYLFQA